MVKMELQLFFFIFKINVDEDILIKKFSLFFLTVRIFFFQI